VPQLTLRANFDGVTKLPGKLPGISKKLTYWQKLFPKLSSSMSFGMEEMSPLVFAGPVGLEISLKSPSTGNS